MNEVTRRLLEPRPLDDRARALLALDSAAWLDAVVSDEPDELVPFTMPDRKAVGEPGGKS